MSEALHVAVVGATGAVGREVMAVIDRVSWRPDIVSPVASASTSTHIVEYGDQKLPVLDGADLDTGILDAIILAGPSQVNRQIGARAIDDGVIVVDLSDAFADESDVPLVVPWINPEVLAHGGIRDVVRLPGATALLIASVLAPLARAGIVGETDATVFVPASSWGKGGIEELSKQVVTLFNAGTPPRKVFPNGLAFDLMPAIGELDEQGSTSMESLAVAQVQALLGGPIPVSVTCVGVPVFSGISAQLTLRLNRRVMPDLLDRIFRDGGVGVPDEEGARFLPRPRRVEGQPFAQVGRIRVDNEGTVLRIWASMDNLRGAATAAVSLVGAAIKQRAG